MGNNGHPDKVHIYGFRESLRLDDRSRFRIPDELAAILHEEFGRTRGESNVPSSAFQRLSFYFAPGPASKIFLYPASNIEVALERLENPPSGADPTQVRAARDYFYNMLRFVEADRQNRIIIPEHLREHGELGAEEKQVVLVSHDLWLAIMKGSVAKQEDQAGREAFDRIGADMLDPVRADPGACSGDTSEP